ncbi:MAG: pirin family protein [Pseudomonadota bacterium]
MIALRKASERGHARHGWLESWHSFSFADYHDPAHMRFASLRVINEDIVQPDSGFGMHPHRDMEILTYILDGALRHQDSMGNSEQIRAGEVQVMSAGTGVTHSEVNASATQAVHLLQIWITPAQQNLPPGYQQKVFGASAKRGRWCLLASQDQAAGSLRIHQDARVSAALLDGTETLAYPVPSGRKIYLHVARGMLSANGQMLGSGDALMYSDEQNVELSAGVNAEVLLFDMA